MNSGLIAIIVAVVVFLILFTSSVKTVAQGTVAVTTIFGKYRAVKRPGLNILVPFVDRKSVV